MALPNTTAQARFAHVNIYIDADATYSGQHHVVTDPLALPPGSLFDDDHFPRPW